MDIWAFKHKDKQEAEAQSFRYSVAVARLVSSNVDRLRLPCVDRRSFTQKDSICC